MHQDFFDVVIVVAGASGMTAALRLSKSKLNIKILINQIQIIVEKN